MTHHLLIGLARILGHRESERCKARNHCGAEAGCVRVN